ncbi:hypothetical protein ACNH6C_05055 [Bdellovibrio bacteriovorus]|uniref:hypothetical protein n=1 Tax=Bdellovibrio bacteriovorus TaxID=959 RepID=UPI003A810214
MRKTSAFHHGEGSYRGNAMTPLNWFTGITEACLLPTAALNADSWLGVGCFVLAIIIILFYGIVYLYWTFKDPDRLQTEGFNLVRQGLLVEDSTDRNLTQIPGGGSSGEVVDGD